MYQISRTTNTDFLTWDDNGTVWHIPMDPANRHYQEYLEWVAEGNKAMVIDE